MHAWLVCVDSPPARVDSGLGDTLWEEEEEEEEVFTEPSLSPASPSTSGGGTRPEQNYGGRCCTVSAVDTALVCMLTCNNDLWIISFQVHVVSD